MTPLFFCSTNHTCRCRENEHCDDGEYCDTGVLSFGSNSCVAYRDTGERCSTDKQCESPEECLGKPRGRCGIQKIRELGESCEKDAECSIGKCEEDICVCTEDSHCWPSRCRKPVTGQNFCD
ncbi:MAG: hypothetical protein KBC53_12900 [Nitrosomonas sp.]|nr:hypothetical protein [Nitrosomonas sp.]